MPNQKGWHRGSKPLVPVGIPARDERFFIFLPLYAGIYRVTCGQQDELSINILKEVEFEHKKEQAVARCDGVIDCYYHTLNFEGRVYK